MHMVEKILVTSAVVLMAVLYVALVVAVLLHPQG